MEPLPLAVLLLPPATVEASPPAVFPTPPPTVPSLLVTWLMTPGPPPHDVVDHANDVATLLDHLKLDSVHVVGTSFGGVVGTLFAARFPTRARSLITIASADGFDEQIKRPFPQRALITHLRAGLRRILTKDAERFKDFFLVGFVCLHSSRTFNYKHSCC